MENQTLEVITDLRQAEEYGRFMEKIGWKTYKVGVGKLAMQFFVRKLGPFGIAKIQRVRGALPWEEINEILKRERVFMCKYEPAEGSAGEYGFRQDSWPLVGGKTLQVDLCRKENEILSSFKKDSRYCIRQAIDKRQSISFNEHELFYDIWKKAASAKGLWIPSRKDFAALRGSFDEKCFSVVINDQAGCFVLMHRGIAYYYYSGALTLGKSDNLPYLVVWEAMKYAKKLGARIWDFEGIYDKRWPNKGWLGFTHFKKSFGGVEVEFPGCFTRWSWLNLLKRGFVI